MAQNSLQPTENSPAQAATGGNSRLFFIDHLRAALIILVVLHHAAMVYGAGGPFYYVEPPFEYPLTYLVLLMFLLFNQGWFMGALYLIAGYFTPGSFDRKGSGSFLKNRLVRLGIPLIIWIFVLSPLASIGYWQMPAVLTGITDPLSWQVYPFLLGLGVAWFIALLLIFSFGYAIWRRLTRNRTATPKTSTPSYLGIGIFILGLALLSYLIRIVIPIGKEVFNFPTLGYLPQYLTLFIVGIVAYRRDWFRTTPGSMGVVGFVTALVATVLLFPLALSGNLFSLEVPEVWVFLGGGTFLSGVYALWDSIFVVGMCLAAITFFRRFSNQESSFGSFLAQQSYAVYIIHVPIVVFIGIALKGVQLAPMFKFGILAVIAVPTCFVLAYLIRKIPGVSKVL